MFMRDTAVTHGSSNTIFAAHPVPKHLRTALHLSETVCL